MVGRAGDMESVFFKSLSRDKTLGENIGERVQDSGFGNNFLAMTSTGRQ